MTPDKSCIVYTPTELADALVGAVMPSRPTPDQRWLEPCVGQGALLVSLAKNGISTRQIFGLDLARMAEPTDALGRIRRGIDFLGWSKRTLLRFDRIVANPPYLAIRQLKGTLLENALTTTVPTDGTFVPHRANCWYAFLCASIALLRQGGALAFVLPAAWEYADYAEPMRIGINALFQSVATYRSVHPLFSGVQEGAVVLVAHGYGLSSSGPVSRSVYERQSYMLRAIETGRSKQLCGPAMSIAVAQRVDARPLYEIARVRIGAVTGDGAYFLLNEDRRLALGLPVESLVPILSRAAHLMSAEISHEDWEHLRQRGERIWLFRPPRRLLKHPAVARYLRLARQAGGCNRAALQVRRREPDWYRVKLPKAPDGFVSGMGRYGPWISLRRDANITATNTLYAIRFRRQLSLQEMSAWSLMLITGQVQEQMNSVLRQYPDGLVKMEPGDFTRLLIPRPRRISGALGAYREAVQFLLSGDRSKAIDIANGFV